MLPGQRLGIDRFDLVRPLGSGGMGTVYEARDRRTGGRLAIKVLHEREGDALYHFKNESRVLSDLSHPFLVRFGELFEDGGQFYLTMELVDGENFLDYVRPGSTRRKEQSPTPERHDGQLDIHRLRDALGQLASALITLHASGVIHRDVKPQNVLVTKEGRVVLLDFGVALSAEPAREHRPELAGTFAYMAPEQFTGVNITEAADWYAVGVLLNEALTGRLPHPAIRPWSEVRKRGASLAATSPEDPGLPLDLSDLCVGLMEPDATRRLNEKAIARCLGLELKTERSRASFRSQLRFSRGVFVAREKELALLRDALSDSRRGCKIVRVVGDSGVGKTALLRRWFEELADKPEGAVVLSSRCFERETLPYRGVDGVIDALSRYLEDADYRHEAVPAPRDAALLGLVFPVLRAISEFAGPPEPELTREDPQEARRLAFSALRELLTTLSAQKPLVIHVDDAHWIDAESVKLLSFLVAGEGAPRMLLVLTERPALTDALDELIASPRTATTWRLGPLEARDSEQLASKLLGHRAGQLAILPATVAEQSGGHPLFIHELVLQGSAEMRMGASLEAAISTRLAHLDAGCRKLLDLIALAVSPLPHHVAQDAAELDPVAYPWVLSTLRSENLASFQGLAGNDNVHTYHDRIRELVVGAMNVETRKETHLRLAQSIETRLPEELDALAYHFFEAGVRDKAASYARSAAKRALQKLAFEHAARFFEIALRVEDEAGARASLEESLAQALANAGRGLDAAEAYLRAASFPGAAHANELRLRAGEQLLRVGHVERGIEILSAILRNLGLRIPHTDFETGTSLARSLFQLQTRLYFRGLRFAPRSAEDVPAHQRLRLDGCWTVATGLCMVHHLRATDFQARSLLLALRVGEPDRILKSAALLAASLSMVEVTRPLARRLMAGARTLAEESPSAENGAWLALTTGASAMGDWDFGRTAEWCARAESEFRGPCTAVGWEVVTSQAFTLWSLVFQGRVKVAAARLPDLLASARARGDRNAIATLILSPLHLLGLAADEPARVRQECEEIVSEWPEDFACFQHMCAAYVLAHVDLYEGHADKAWTHVLRSWHMLRRGHLAGVQFQRVDLLGLRARVALAVATSESRIRPDWLSRARRDAKRLKRIKIEPALGMAALVEGAALQAEGRRAEAAADFKRAGAHFEARGMLLHSGFANLAAALVADDERACRALERELTDLGVVAPRLMLRIWAPGSRS